mgnify:CR=1 FL=1
MKKIMRRLEGKQEQLNEENKEIEMNETDFLQMVLQEMDNKTLDISGDFDIKMVRHVQEFARNLYFYEADENPNIRINISSNGGEATALFAIISTLNELKELWGCTITTVVKGFAYSAGAVLFLYGDEKEMTDTDEIMLHQCLYFAQGSLKDHEDELKRSKKLQKRIDKVITTKSNLNQYQLNKLYKKGDAFLDYEDCLKLGIINEKVEEDE